jgi:hypothetical protein
MDWSCPCLIAHAEDVYLDILQGFDYGWGFRWNEEDSETPPVYPLGLAVVEEEEEEEEDEDEDDSETPTVYLPGLTVLRGGSKRRRKRRMRRRRTPRHRRATLRVCRMPRRRRRRKRSQKSLTRGSFELRVIVVNEPDDEQRTFYLQPNETDTPASITTGTLLQQGGVMINYEIPVVLHVHQIPRGSDEEASDADEESEDSWDPVYAEYVEPIEPGVLAWWILRYGGGPSGGWVAAPGIGIRRWHAVLGEPSRFTPILSTETVLIHHNHSEGYPMHCRLIDVIVDGPLHLQRNVRHVVARHRGVRAEFGSAG